ncbi:MAG: hypothetical protein J7K83_02450, partial [Candidatus Aenigmarchaeota archaeon]|nr:hypothetical protein [Candidatus Aenigmarchaeota archaeon]
MKKGISPLLIIGGLVLLAVIAGVGLLVKNFLSGGFLGPSGIQESILEKMLPKTDVVSEDVSGTSKYDDAIRVVYSSNNCSEESVYYKQGNIVNETYNYYKDDLTSRGWQIVSENHIGSLPVTFQGVDVAVENIKQMILQKGDEALDIAVGTVNFAGKTYTLIHVQKNYLDCTSSEEDNYTETEENQVNFGQIQEIQVAGFQADIRNAFQPLLNKAFGDSKLVDATMIDQYYGQKYYVKDKPSSDSVNNLITYLQDAGYTLVLQDLSYSSDYKVMVTGRIADGNYNIVFSISKDL